VHGLRAFIGLLDRLEVSLAQFLDGTQVGGVAERLRPWVGEDFVRDKLKTIRKKDRIVITSTQSLADALGSGIASALLAQTQTLYLPAQRIRIRRRAGLPRRLQAEP